MWYALFIVGGVWFWALAIIEIAFLSFFVQDENPLASFVSLVIFVLLIHLFGNATFLSYVKDNPWDIVRWGVLYAIIGFGWAVCKYFYVAKRVSNAIDAIKKDFGKNIKRITKEWVWSNKDKEVDLELVWQNYLKREMDYEDREKMSFRYQGGKIIFWMSYWPISMFWTFFTDILKNAFKWMYETFLIKIFEKIHEYTIGNAAKFDDNLRVDKEFNLIKPPPTLK